MEKHNISLFPVVFEEVADYVEILELASAKKIHDFINLDNIIWCLSFTADT